MRLVIHAGFGKCGSSAIQVALAANQTELKRKSVFLFGRGLSIEYGAPRVDAPFWLVAREFSDPARRKTVSTKVAAELARLQSVAPEATALLSAEILGQPGNARLFKGVDEFADTTLVFYIRPQFEWIPSAWKQWALKSGTLLEEFTEKCLAKRTPDFLRSIEQWSEALPKARIVVRVLAKAVAEYRSPAGDFFDVLGLKDQAWRTDESKVNPSFDFALLHVMNKNPWLFRNMEDREPFKALMRILPERHLGTNIKMLRLEDETRIAERFAADNIAILTKYCGLSAQSADQVYDTYFRPRGTERAYPDVEELEKINRALGILLETVLSRFGGKPIIRPPYWKIPRRIFDRLRLR